MSLAFIATRSFSRTPMPSIEAVNLTKRYGRFEALSNLDLKVTGGKCVGFLGPNGSGKTTTLKILCDMIKPSSGRAYLNGTEVKRNRKAALASCGVLVESPEIYGSLTVKEALSMFAEMTGIPKEGRPREVERVASEVKMHEWLDRKFETLSKGMKQRTNIAAAMLGDPAVLLLDEPTTGLDPRGMAEIRTILRSLKQRSRLIFMSSHLINEVTEICDEVAVISRGKLLFYDKIEVATRRFSAGWDAYRIEFARAVERQSILGALKDVAPDAVLEQGDARTLELRMRNGKDLREEVIAKLVSMNLGLVSFGPSSSSSNALEEAYLSLVKESS